MLRVLEMVELIHQKVELLNEKLKLRQEMFIKLFP